ncbi:MAG: fibrobacter succinogenes major paralogous domain-containing protein [Bacteroidia bacterium]|nr:fibrobacter succinogenes major paralogous domain-containing protein [Bacteroidia bacterium]
MKINDLLLAIAISTITMSTAAQVAGTFVDSRDGKTYKTVKIGTQTWMAENLAFKAKSGWWIFGNYTDMAADYGYLYDWETAKNACPSGWHLPSDDEWTTLTIYLGGDSVAGGKLKEEGTKHWMMVNTGATNESGFTALPGGNRFIGGGFDYIGYTGIWWSSTENKNSVRTMYIYNDSKRVSRYYTNKRFGYSVRCLQD